MKKISLILFLFITSLVYGQTENSWDEWQRSIQYKKYNPENASGDGIRRTPGNPGSGSGGSNSEPGSTKSRDPVNIRDGVVRGGSNTDDGPFKGVYDDFDIDDYDPYSDDYGEDGYSPASRDDDIKRRAPISERRASDEWLNEIETETVEIDPPKSPTMSNGVSQGVMIIGIIVLAVIIAFIIFSILKNRNSGGSKVNIKSDDFSIEEISKTDLEIALEQALKEDDYRAAIRVYFLFAIKDLSEKDWIKWEKEKTNTAYLYEMRDKKEYTNFEHCVTVYEIAWYGSRQISKDDFDSVEPIFKNLLNQLGVK